MLSIPGIGAHVAPESAVYSTVRVEHDGTGVAVTAFGLKEAYHSSVLKSAGSCTTIVVAGTVDAGNGLTWPESEAVTI